METEVSRVTLLGGDFMGGSCLGGSFPGGNYSGGTVSGRNAQWVIVLVGISWGVIV